MSADPDRSSGVRRVFAYATIVLAQLGLWYLATPGPLLVGDASLGPSYAFRAVAMSLVVLGAGTLVIAALARAGVRDVGLALPTRPRAWWEALALIPAVALVLAWSVDPASFLGAYPWPSTGWLAGGPGRVATWVAGYALYYLAFETFYRGAVMAWARRRFGPAEANLLQALLATLVHLGKPWPETLLAFPASLAFGWLRLRWGSLLPVVVLHLAVGVTLDLVLLAGGSP